MPSFSGAGSGLESSAAVEVSLPGNSVSYDSFRDECLYADWAADPSSQIRRCALFLMG